MKDPRDKDDFFLKVFEVTKLIPRGRVTSYGAIATYIGMAGSARTVGWAMNNAQGDKEIPAHRVVNRNGHLTGKHHFPTPYEMQRRLEEEGVEVVDDVIIDFKNRFWNPSLELEL